MYTKQNPIDIEITRLVKEALTCMAASDNEYHNDHHVSGMLAELENNDFGIDVATKRRIRLAVGFHDVVYVPGANQASGMDVNENMSSMFFYRRAMKSPLWSTTAQSLLWLTLDVTNGKGYREDTVDCNRVSELIEATTIKHHMSEDSLGRDHDILLDLDLSSLSQHWTSFLAHQRNIAKEHSVPGDVEMFREIMVKQAEFLGMFLDKKRIYRTSVFAERESEARMNISRFKNMHIQELARANTHTTH